MRRLRLLLVLILWVAVPIQGMAAAAMLFCGMPAGQGSAMSQAMVHDHHSMPDAEDAHADHVAAVTGADLQTHGEGSATTKAPMKAELACSVCAAHCHAAAMAPTVLPLPHFVPTGAAAASPIADDVRDRSTPPPDKPPRA